MEIPLRVHQSNPYQWQTQITGFLANIASQDPQPTGIQRQGVVYGKLRRKIGNGPSQVITVPCNIPGVVCYHISIEGCHYSVVESKKCWIDAGRLQLNRAYLVQQFDRVVSTEFPYRIVQDSKKITCLGMPTPPQVMRKLIQSSDAPW